jgi:hypothetical protein
VLSREVSGFLLLQSGCLLEFAFWFDL